MTKLSSAVLLLSAFCLTTACKYSDENPQNTVGSAAKALQAEDNQRFLGLLTGPAKAQYQNPAAIQDLQQYISQFRKLSVGSEKLINETVVSTDKTFRTYALEVVSRNQHVLNVEVKCQLNYGSSTASYDGLLRQRLVRDREERPHHPVPDADNSSSSDNSGGSSYDDRPERPHHPVPDPVSEPSQPSVPDRPHHPVPDPVYEPSYPPPERPNHPPRPERPDDDYDHDYDHNHPGYPSHPNDPYNDGHDGHYYPPSNPTPPAQPNLSWHQACRITSIQK
jgi:hypothetical protein